MLKEYVKAAANRAKAHPSSVASSYKDKPGKDLDRGGRVSKDPSKKVGKAPKFITNTWLINRTV